MDPRRLLPVLAAVACACVVATLIVTLARPDPEGSRRESSGPVAPDAGQRGPASILADWDAQRARAWAEGDVEALEALYVDGSRSGSADVGLLRDYRRRGLTVEALTTQVLALHVVERSAERLVLLVTDRVVGGRAVGGATPVALPADRASTRRVVLVRAGERWRVAEARDQASAAASTSRTSSSSKS